MAQEETKFPEGSRIVPINPASKYVVLIPKDTDNAEIDLLAQHLTDWWYDENPFLIMTDEIVLVDVSKADVVEEDHHHSTADQIIDLHSIAARKQLEEKKNAEKEEN